MISHNTSTPSSPLKPSPFRLRHTSLNAHPKPPNHDNPPHAPPPLLPLLILVLIPPPQHHPPPLRAQIPTRHPGLTTQLPQPLSQRVKLFILVRSLPGPGELDVEAVEHDFLAQRARGPGYGCGVEEGAEGAQVCAFGFARAEEGEQSEGEGGGGVAFVEEVGEGGRG